jgi:HlyD family secretion protein
MYLYSHTMRLVKYILPLFLVLAVAVFFWMRSETGGEVDTAPMDAPKGYGLFAAEEGVISDIIPAAGKVEANNLIEIGAEVNGKVLSVMVAPGDQVSKGQLLVKIDPSPFEASLNEREARRDIIKQNIQLARYDLEIIQNKNTNRAGEDLGIAQEVLFELEINEKKAESQIIKLEAELEQVEIAIAEAKRRLRLTDILSPIDGVVLDVFMREGQTVNASFNSPKLLNIASPLDTVKVIAEVSEIDIGRINSEMSIRFKVDAYPRDRFFGKGLIIRPSPKTIGRSTVFLVEFTADNRIDILRPGMTASIDFVNSDPREVMRIPIDALYIRMPDIYTSNILSEEKLKEHKIEIERHQKKYGDEAKKAFITGLQFGVLARKKQRIVFVYKGGIIYSRGVSIGVEDDMYVEVKDGDLELGEIVLVPADFEKL